MDEARSWRARHRDQLPDREQAFVDAVIQLGTRAQRVRRVVTAGLFGLLSTVIAGGAVAFVQVRRAERRALDKASLATREANRARQAEDQVKAQLDVIQQEQTAKAAAENEVQRGREDLRAANAHLRKAVALAQEESKRAQEAAERATTLTESLQKSNVRLENLLAGVRVQAERLEKERRKIANELR